MQLMADDISHGSGPDSGPVEPDSPIPSDKGEGVPITEDNPDTPNFNELTGEFSTPEDAIRAHVEAILHINRESQFSERRPFLVTPLESMLELSGLIRAEMGNR